ncbi:hypothetical protein K503DRAFT_772778, partial [Rhizopogon vinicolor AM-OR11-026]
MIEYMEQLVSSTYIKVQGHASPHAPALHTNSTLHFYGPCPTQTVKTSHPLIRL